MIRRSYQRVGKKQRIQTLSRQCSRLCTLLAVLGLLVFGSAAWFIVSNDRKAAAFDHLPEIALTEDSDLAYDSSQLQPHQAQFFSYPLNSSERVRLLVSRDSKGDTRAAFASCTACYRFRNQHYLKNGELICGRCEQAMRVADSNEQPTGKACIAVPLPFLLENNKIVIHARAIRESTQIFEKTGASSQN